MNYIFIAAFFLAGSTFTKVIPQFGFGHLPGLSVNTSWCMGQVYCTLAGLTFFVLVVSGTEVVELAANTVIPENRMVTVIRVTFFMNFKIRKWINSIG